MAPRRDYTLQDLPNELLLDIIAESLPHHLLLARGINRFFKELISQYRTGLDKAAWKNFDQITDKKERNNLLTSLAMCEDPKIHQTIFEKYINSKQFPDEEDRADLLADLATFGNPELQWDILRKHIAEEAEKLLPEECQVFDNFYWSTVLGALGRWGPENLQWEIFNHHIVHDHLNEEEDLHDVLIDMVLSYNRDLQRAILRNYIYEPRLETPKYRAALTCALVKYGDLNLQREIFDHSIHHPDFLDDLGQCDLLEAFIEHGPSDLQEQIFLTYKESLLSFSNSSGKFSDHNHRLRLLKAFAQYGDPSMGLEILKSFLNYRQQTLDQENFEIIQSLIQSREAHVHQEILINYTKHPGLFTESEEQTLFRLLFEYGNRNIHDQLGDDRITAAQNVILSDLNQGEIKDPDRQRQLLEKLAEFGRPAIKERILNEYLNKERTPSKRNRGSLLRKLYHYGDDTIQRMIESAAALLALQYGLHSFGGNSEIPIALWRFQLNEDELTAANILAELRYGRETAQTITKLVEIGYDPKIVDTVANRIKHDLNPIKTTSSHRLSPV